MIEGRSFTLMQTLKPCCKLSEASCLPSCLVFFDHSPFIGTQSLNSTSMVSECTGRTMLVGARAYHSLPFHGCHHAKGIHRLHRVPFPTNEPCRLPWESNRAGKRAHSVTLCAQSNDLHDSMTFLGCWSYLVVLCDVFEGISEANVACESLCPHLD